MPLILFGKGTHFPPWLQPPTHTRPPFSQICLCVPPHRSHARSAGPEKMLATPSWVAMHTSRGLVGAGPPRVVLLFTEVCGLASCVPIYGYRRYIQTIYKQCHRCDDARNTVCQSISQRQAGDTHTRAVQTHTRGPFVLRDSLAGVLAACYCCRRTRWLIYPRSLSNTPVFVRGCY